MAIARTGPATGRDGDGKPTGPAVRDIGAAAAGAVDGLAALGRISATRGLTHLQDDSAQAAGAGPIERRVLSPAELAARAMPPPAVPRFAAKPSMGVRSFDVPAHMHRQPATPPKEEPVPVPTPDPPAIPCGTCLHAPVCGLRELLELTLVRIAAAIDAEPPGKAVRIRTTVECDHYLGGSRADHAPNIPDPIPEPIRREHGGEAWRTKPLVQTPDEVQASRMRGAEATKRIHAERRVSRIGEASIEEVKGTGRRHPGKAGEREERDRRAVDALVALDRHNGDRRAAAAELGMRPNAFAMVVKYALVRAAVAS